MVSNLSWSRLGTNKISSTTISEDQLVTVGFADYWTQVTLKHDKQERRRRTACNFPSSKTTGRLRKDIAIEVPSLATFERRGK